MQRERHDVTAHETDVVVVMGVSGTGKSTIAKAISARLGRVHAEGDAFHPEANIEKMRSGQPLTEEDRWPWLRSVGEWITRRSAEGENTVVTCSALRRAYRDLLREGRPEVRFCHLTAPQEVIDARLGERTDHYMPSSLLRSQYDTLEPLEPDELASGSVEVSVEGSVDQVVQRALDALGLTPPADQGEGHHI